jgi:CRP-like cAMP-binding protein
MIVSGEGIADDSGAFRITQQQLANMTGATRESVNKHLNAFVDEGMVRLERGRIHILNTARLREASVGRE